MCARVKEAAEWLRTRGVPQLEGVVMLGSGWGGAVQDSEALLQFEVHDIPGYPSPHVVGHTGMLLINALVGAPYAMVKGRRHLYEGATLEHMGFPVRLAHTLGAKKIIIACSAGGICPSYRPGDFMLVKDHVRPGLSILGSTGVRVAYDEAWRRSLLEEATLQGMRIAEGTYAWMLGPSFETSAEVRYLEVIGANVVGMSLIQEAAVANVLDMQALGIALIANVAAGRSSSILSHEEVLSAGKNAAGAMQNLLELASTVS